MSTATMDDFLHSASIDVVPNFTQNLDRYWRIAECYSPAISIEQEIDADRRKAFITHYRLPASQHRPKVFLGFFDSENAEDDCMRVTHLTSANTLEDELSSSDLISQYLAEFEEMWVETQKTYQGYANRIEELREFASEDDESSGLGESSKEDFWWFVESMPLARKAELVLMDNGNLRAVWKGDDKSHIGLQFLGDRLGEYVIFKRRPHSKQISRVAGIDTLEGLKKQVRAFDIPLLENR